MLLPEIQEHRKADHEIAPYILSRWSPRAMTGEPLAEEELFSLFEAARWAPSSFNEQPWHFAYAIKGTKHWQVFLDLLMEKNHIWCSNAGALVVVLSRELSSHNGHPNKMHSFDTGAAWMALALEASRRGLVAHGMGGIHRDTIPHTLNVPSGYRVECMVAIGKRAPVDTLDEQFREREKPSGRKSISEFITQGPFEKEKEKTEEQ